MQIFGECLKNATRRINEQALISVNLYLSFYEIKLFPYLCPNFLIGLYQRMNRLLVHIILSVIVLSNITSCQYNDQVTTHILSQAESLLASNPQKAYTLLDSIGYPENLNARQNAQWCMLMGKIADTLYTDLPYSHQLERAMYYYRHNGSTEELAHISLYLGRAYVEDRNYEDAMHTYLKALDLSLSTNNYNLVGYADSYIGDLYYHQASYDMALEKYLLAATYFKKADNKRSQAFAYRDAGRILCFKDSLNQALTLMKQAQSILLQLKDSTGMADIFNGLGNIYATKGDYSSAEYYFKKGIEYDKKESAPDYLALTQLYIQKGDFNQAQNYIKKVKQSQGNEHTYTDYFYLLYEIEKSTGHTEKALSYLAHYICIKDSIRNDKNQSYLSALEEKYNHAKVSMANYKLKKEKRLTTYLLAFVVLCFMFVLIAYQLILKRKALALSQKKNDILLLSNEILSLKNELLNKEEELNKLSCQLMQQKKQVHIEGTLQQTQIIYQQKLQEIESLNHQLNEKHLKMLQEAPIIKRIQKLATQVIPNATKSPLTKKDWQAIHELIDAAYPHIASYCKNAGLDEQEEKLCYLSIFNLGTAGEAVLLNYTVSTINKYRQNARRKLNINNRNLSLHEFLVNQ